MTGVRKIVEAKAVRHADEHACSAPLPPECGTAEGLALLPHEQQSARALLRVPVEVSPKVGPQKGRQDHYPLARPKQRGKSFSTSSSTRLRSAPPGGLPSCADARPLWQGPEVMRRAPDERGPRPRTCLRWHRVGGGTVPGRGHIVAGMGGASIPSTIDPGRAVQPRHGVWVDGGRDGSEVVCGDAS